jgi:hypothetical protein
LGFSKDDPLPEIHLNQLYDFFELIDVKFVNIFDYTCRYCNIPIALSQQIYNEEQKYAEKPNAFGRKSKKRVKKRKRSRRRL